MRDYLFDTRENFQHQIIYIRDNPFSFPEIQRITLNSDLFMAGNIFLPGGNVTEHPLHHGDFHLEEDLRHSRAEQRDLANGTTDGEHSGEYRSRLRVQFAARLVGRDIAGDLTGRQSSHATAGNADRDVFNDADSTEDAHVARYLRRQQYHPTDPRANVQYRASGNRDEDAAADGDLPVHTQQDPERI